MLLPNNTEEIDVGVVCGEVDEDSPGSMIQPQVITERDQESSTFFFRQGQVLVVTPSAVCG